MSQSPSSPRETLSGPVGVVAVVVFVLLVAYAFLVGVGGLFLAVWLAVAAFSLWLVYRFVAAHERIAAAQERRADAGERRARVAEARAGTGPGPAAPTTAADPTHDPSASGDDRADESDADDASSGW